MEINITMIVIRIRIVLYTHRFRMATATTASFVLPTKEHPPTFHVYQSYHRHKAWYWTQMMIPNICRFFNIHHYDIQMTLSSTMNIICPRHGPQPSHRLREHPSPQVPIMIPIQKLPLHHNNNNDCP